MPPPRFFPARAAKHAKGQITMHEFESLSHSCGTPPIPPKYAFSQVVGYIKGKWQFHLAQVYGERNRRFIGLHF